MANGSQFSIDVVAALNTDNVPKQLDELNARLTKTTSNMVKIPIGIDENGKRVFGEFLKDVRTYKDELNNLYKRQTITNPFSGMVKSDSLKKITDSVKTLTTETHKWTNSSGEVNKWTTTIDSAGNRVTTKVKEAVTAVGELTRTTKTAINGKNVGQAKTEIIEFAESTTTSVNTVRGTIQDLGKSYEGMITTTEKVSTNGEYLKTVISKYTNEMGQAVEKTEQFNKAGDRVATTMRKISEATPTKNTETRTWIDKNGVKTVEQYLNGVLQLTTRTREYVNENKELVKETTQLEGTERRLISTHTERSRNIQKETEELNKEIDSVSRLRNALISTTTTTSKGKTTQFGDKSGKEYEALITTIERVDAANKKVIETTYEFTNAQGQLVKQTRTTDEQGKKLAEDTIQISNAQEKASSSTQKYNTATQQATQSTKTFGQSLSDALARLARYYIASLPIQAFRKSITEAIQTVKDFDSALIEFKKVSDLAGESLTKYVEKLAEMGEITGSTMQAMVEAATQFRKSGYNDEDSAKLASVAEMYRNIADEEVSAADSASFIIAQMKAFNIEASQSEHIIDAVNEVSNHFAVSSADLAGNLGKVSAAMAVNGTEFEEVLGMMTAVTEITRNASTASRGLSMISSRLVQVLDDSSSTGKKLVKIYKDLGIALKDENGQMRGTYDILKDLASQWDSLSSNQQKYIALTSAGARQTQNFVALMKNFNQAISATEMAYKSSGSAAKENEKVMDSIAKKAEILKSEFQQLVIGKGGLQDFAKKILDIGIALLKFANSDIGKVIIRTTLFLTTLNLLNKGFVALTTKVIPNLANSIMLLAGRLGATTISSNSFAMSLAGLSTEEVILTGETITLGHAFQSLTAAIASNPIGLAIAGLAVLISLSIQASNKVQEYRERIEEAKEKVVELKTSINELKKAQENTAKISKADKDRLTYLEKRLELENAIVEAASKGQTVGGTPLPPTYEEYTKFASDPEAYFIKRDTEKKNLSQKGFSSSVGDVDIISDAITSYIQLNKEIAEWNDGSEKGIELLEEKYEESQKYLPILQSERDRLGELKDKYTQNNSEYERLITKKESIIPLTIEEEKKLEELESSQKLLSETDQLRLTTLEEIIGDYEKSVDSITTYQDAIDEFGEESEEADNIIQEFAKDLGISEEELLSNAEAMHLSIDSYYEYAKAAQETQEILQNTSTSIDGLQDALSKAQNALDEYTQQGYLTLDTFQDLMSVSSEYLTALINEEGQIEINQNALGNLVNQLKETKIEELQAAEMADILAYAHGDVAEMSVLAQTSVTNAGNSAVIAGNNASKGATGFWSLAEAISAANNAANGGVIDATHVDANIQKIHNSYKKLADSIKNTEVNTTRAGNAASKAGNKAKSAAGGAKKATDDLKNSVNDLKSQYDKVITFITGRIDKQIKAVQKAKDEAVKAVEAEIKAREKQKDKALDAIEQQINALEREKKAREKYWDDQIDALKKANDERKDALELQEKLDALERAKNTKVKVYKEGQGFVYDVDQTAVAEAQKALDEYLSKKAYEDELERLNALKDAEVDNYDKRLDALNAYKDKVQESYEKQIEALEAHKQALEEQYDAQIEYYQNFKEQFEEMVKAYEDKQTELLASQLTGINFENNNWMTRLDNLAKFVSEYNRLQEQLNTGNTNVTNNATMTSGSSYSPSSTKTGKTVSGNTMTPQEREQAARVQHQKVVVNKHASGVGSVSDNEIAIVGENPNKEIVIGSKINNGELMSLNKGTGVVNAKSSNTLAGLLNQVGQFGSSGFGSGNGTLNSNINNDSLTINGVTIQGANIKDPETFVNGLLNLKAEALQRAYRHR